MNDRVFPLFLEFLPQAAVQAESLRCIHEVASKGMDEPVKFALLKHINIVSIIDSFNPVRFPHLFFPRLFVFRFGLTLLTALSNQRLPLRRSRNL